MPAKKPEIKDKIIFKEDIVFASHDAEKPFENALQKVEQGGVYVWTFAGLVINLFGAKGDFVIGPLKYLDSKSFNDRKNLPADLEKCVLITDHLDGQLYPLISALGVSAIIANSIESDVFDEIIIISTPVAVISGFGLLSINEKLVKYFKSNESKQVWLDTLYDRLVLPESKTPAFMKSFKYFYE